MAQLPALDQAKELVKSLAKSGSGIAGRRSSGGDIHIDKNKSRSLSLPVLNCAASAAPSSLFAPRLQRCSGPVLLGKDLVSRPSELLGSVPEPGPPCGACCAPQASRKRPLPSQKLGDRLAIEPPRIRDTSRSCYEAECHRRFIVPKYARSAQAALHGDEFDLVDSSLGDAHLEALLCDNQLVPAQTIRCWKLCSARLTHASMRALGLALQHGVKVLNLAHNELGTRGIESVQALSSRHQLTQLRSLNLSYNGFKNDAVALLCDALKDCQILLRLDLNCNEISEGASLGNLLGEHCRLTRLALHGNHINAAGGAALFQGALINAQQGGRLADVDVAWNNLSEGNSLKFSSALANVLRQSCTLFHLDLSYNCLDAQSCKVIADAMRDNHQLYGLHMVGNAVVVDANGFLIALTEESKLGARPSGPMVFGDPRLGPSQLLGAAQRPSRDREAKKWCDNDILRDRDPLEQRTTCWACEGWERAELKWFVPEGEELPRTVWAFTNVDNFRLGMRLQLLVEERCFVAARMMPPCHRLLVIFQVDTALRLGPDMEVEHMDPPCSIELCVCKDVPRSSHKVVNVSEVSVASVATVQRTELNVADSGLAGTRVVLLDGPGGPVQLPRVTESEYQAKAGPTQQKSILRPFRQDTPQILKKCFMLDWSMMKKGRLVPDAESEAVAQLIESRYGQIVALYRHLSAKGVSGSSSFGVTALDASNFAVEAGLADGQSTRLADVDRFFVAASGRSSEQRRDLLVRNEKVLLRFQFLELLLRIADQRFRQSCEVMSMAAAFERLFQHIGGLADVRLQEMESFFKALHGSEVEEVYRKHMSNLAAVHQYFSCRSGQIGHNLFMSHFEFRTLLEEVGAYDNDFQQRHSGIAFRMGMMTRQDEYYDSRFQEMNLLEYFHALGAVVFLKTNSTSEGLAESLDVFFTEHLIRGLPTCLGAHA